MCTRSTRTHRHRGIEGILGRIARLIVKEFDPRTVLAIALLALIAMAPSSAPGIPPATTQPADKIHLNVLFIGNSLTASNDLPAVVQAIAGHAGVRLEYETCTAGGSSLEDHWNDKHCRPRLERRQWDFVVLQQGPSTLPQSQAHLRKWSATWADAIRAKGARPALYMVWPVENQADGFERVIESYTNAAEHSRSLLLPAGVAWREARSGAAPLYQPDHLHPTPEGTLLAAMVIARGLAGVDPSKVPHELTLAEGRKLVVAPPVLAAFAEVVSKLPEK